ncbi:MAG: Ferredoxin [Euryarchaeota archaeon ADurb.Bin190]|jgi:ferredoxin|nr:MAG: Ferredoxin [Euryarchaeota archaeon ADurb.Bin190]
MIFMINVSIDREGCISCGQCWGDCPDLFDESEQDGKSQIAEKFRIAGKLDEGVAFEDQEECAKKVAEECPSQVIGVSPPAMGFDPI